MDVDDHGPDLGLILASFRHGGVAVELSKRFKTFAFDPERIGGWCWTGKLVVQRHGVLEPMLDGVDVSQTLGVGSTWLSLALDSGARRTPPIAPTEFLPPVLPVNRPCYDGEPATIDQMVSDLISLFRATKDVIRTSSW